MQEPTREAVNQMPGLVVLEFGASWCPHCQAIQGTMAEAQSQYPQFQHISVEDGKGLPLGRSFRVKLWPTLVFMHNGEIVGQLVRPSGTEILKQYEEIAV